MASLTSLLHKIETGGWAILGLVFVLGIIIFVHEFGHLITAKAFGMRVFVFSFGFGKRLVGFKWGDTDCRVSAIPLGGYVKLEGEPDDHLSEDTAALGDGRDFTARPRWQKFLVYLAGPTMNGVLTIAILTVLFYMIGAGVDASRFDRPIVGALDPGSPAEGAGIKVGDEILSIDGESFPTWEAVYYHVILRPERPLTVKIRRDAEEREIGLRSQASGPEKIGSIGVHPLVRVGEVVDGLPAQAAGLRVDDAILKIGDTPISSFKEISDLVRGAPGRELLLTVWRAGAVFQVSIVPKQTGEGVRIGIGPKTVLRQVGALGALTEATRWAWDNTRLTFDILRQLVTARISPKNLVGPIGIARASGDAARQGPSYLSMLIAMISLQVGILNLFPLAPLDGGHMAIIVAEGILRRDFSLTVKAWIMNAGAAVIFLLIALVLVSDISKLL
jgi:regulator of sigma E protease